MKKRKLGKSNLEVSALGFGGPRSVRSPARIHTKAGTLWREAVSQVKADRPRVRVPWRG